MKNDGSSDHNILEFYHGIFGVIGRYLEESKDVFNLNR
jgi:hypothetical protein